MYLNECPQVVRILQKGFLSIQDRIFLARSQCGFHQGQVLVCCVNEHPAATTLAPTRPPPPAPNQNPNSNQKKAGILPKPGKV